MGNQFSWIQNEGGTNIGCYDRVNHQPCPISLCEQQANSGLSTDVITTTSGNIPGRTVLKSKLTYRNFLGSERANMKTNAVYAGSIIAFGLTGFFIAKKSGKPEIGVLLGAGVGLAGGMIINSLIKK